MEQRMFPPPTQQILKEFILHSNKMERYPSNMDIINKSLSSPQEAEKHPYIKGHFQAINLAMQLASDPNLIPKKSSLNSAIDSHAKLEWMRKLHISLMKPIVEWGEKFLDPDVMSKRYLGSYRGEYKKLGTRIMPNPMYIKDLMHIWLKDVSDFHDSMRTKIENPFLLSSSDIEEMNRKAYNFGIEICCIKPFQDGSNRIGRLTENILRLNWGMKWKIISSEEYEKQKYLEDIFKVQDKKYNNINI